EISANRNLTAEEKSQQGNCGKRKLDNGGKLQQEGMKTWHGGNGNLAVEGTKAWWWREQKLGAGWNRNFAVEQKLGGEENRNLAVEGTKTWWRERKLGGGRNGNLAKLGSGELETWRWKERKLGSGGNRNSAGGENGNLLAREETLLQVQYEANSAKEPMRSKQRIWWWGLRGEDHGHYGSQARYPNGFGFAFFALCDDDNVAEDDFIRTDMLIHAYQIPETVLHTKKTMAKITSTSVTKMGRSIATKSNGQLAQAVTPLAAVMVASCRTGEDMVQRRRIGLFKAKENISGDANGFRKRDVQKMETQINSFARPISNGTMKTKTLNHKVQRKEVECTVYHGEDEHRALLSFILWMSVQTLITTYRRKKAKHSAAQLPTQDRMQLQHDDKYAHRRTEFPSPVIRMGGIVKMLANVHSKTGANAVGALGGVRVVLTDEAGVSCKGETNLLFYLAIWYHIATHRRRVCIALADDEVTGGMAIDNGDKGDEWKRCVRTKGDNAAHHAGVGYIVGIR
ncbi:hypothetical protein BC938DRAFT_475800, partial [Jimgerdemannia flammicorona]